MTSQLHFSVWLHSLGPVDHTYSNAVFNSVLPSIFLGGRRGVKGGGGYKPSLYFRQKIIHTVFQTKYNAHTVFKIIWVATSPYFAYPVYCSLDGRTDL